MLQGFCLAFLTQLDRSSHPVVRDLVVKHIVGGEKKAKSILNQKLPKPAEGMHCRNI